MTMRGITVAVLCALIAGAAEGSRQRLPLSRLPEVRLEFSRISEVRRPKADEAIRRELAAQLGDAGVRISDQSLQHLEFRITEAPIPGCPEIVHLRLEVWLWEPVRLPRFDGAEYVVDTVSATRDHFVRASEVESESQARLLSFAANYVIHEIAAERERETGRGAPDSIPAAPESK